MPTANLYIKEGIGGTMQTYIVERTDDSVTLAFKDANLTLITLEDRRLYVRVKKGDPIEAIKKASGAVSEYYSTLKE